MSAELLERIAALDEELARTSGILAAYLEDEVELLERISILEDENAYLTAQAALDARQVPVGVSRVIRIRELEAENAELRRAGD